MKTLICFLILFSNGFAAFEYFGNNAFLNGTAHSAVVSKKIFSAYLLNPSISSSLGSDNIGITYFKPYGLSGIDFGGVISNFHLFGMGTGFSISTFGNELYRENQATINLSKQFIQKRLAIGINVHWYSIDILNYGQLKTWGLDIGAQYVISPSVISGFSVHNVNQPALNNRQEEIPLITRWGISVNVASPFDVYFAVQKDSWYPLNVLFGIDYQANSFLAVQSGFNTSPAVPCLGIHLKRGWIKLNYVFQYHFDLGVTHFWGISWNRIYGED